MPTTDLQEHCYRFAGGRVALAFSLRLLEDVVAKLGTELKGSFPDNPHVMMGNAKLPLYDLAYSAFIRTLSLDLSGGSARLEAALVATVHPANHPADVISTYEVTLDQPIDLYLAYSLATRELRWAARTSPVANVAPSFTANAERILQDLGVPEPVLETYERKVENVIVWNTSNTFVQLVINALPPIDIGEMAPWLTLLDPIEVDFGPRYAVVTSDKARMSIGNCTPVDIVIEPDPEFPYLMPAPVGGIASATIAAVYLPKTRLIDFVTKSVMPAVMYDTGERGGVVRWRMTGAFGLKKFTLAVAGGIQTGNPWSGDLTLRGTLSAAAEIVLTGVARAWIDGPCGAKVGLASASIQGDGEFAADVVMTCQFPGVSGSPPYGATIEATLAVTRAQLDPNVDIDMVGWPIDDILGELADHLVRKEINKVAGSVHKVGKWQMMGVPTWLVDAIRSGVRLAPVVESLDGVSSVIGVAVDSG